MKRKNRKMNPKVWIGSVLLGFMGFSGVNLFAASSVLPEAAAVQKGPDLTTPAAKLVGKLTSGRGKITDSFPAVNGLVGFVVKPYQGGNSEIVYADSKGEYLFAGSIINAKGQDMTQTYTNQYVNSKIAGPAYAEAMSLGYFTAGRDTAPHKVLVVIDPNCSYCHLIYKEFKPLIESGQVQVRWLPVAFRDATSAGKAAAMLNAGANASKLLDQNEENFNDQTEEGGLTPLQPNASDPVVAGAFAKVDQNTHFFTHYGFQGTPTILYKEKEGAVVMVPGYVQGKAFQDMINNMGSSW